MGHWRGLCPGGVALALREPPDLLRHDCVDGPNESSVVVYQFLRPGRYVVEMYASARDGREYFSPDNSPVIDVVAHQFPGPNSSLPVYLIED